MPAAARGPAKVSSEGTISLQVRRLSIYTDWQRKFLSG
jgi:hypothetical protein